MYKCWEIIDNKISKYKAIDFHIVIDTDNIILGKEIYCKRKQAHAKFGFIINLFVFEIELYIYDIRHWNFDEDRYYDIN